MNNSLIDLKALHDVQYNILLELDRVCKKYGLKYFLAYGTLLGAVRENGFIPWDDDIDTVMPYDDYLKLQEIDPMEWKSPYFLQHYKSDKNYKRCFTKLRNSDTTLITKDLEHLDINQGVDIDIYPLVNLADNQKERKKQYRYTMFHMLLRYDEPPRNHGKLVYFGGKIILGIVPQRIKQILLTKTGDMVFAYQRKHTKDSYIVNGNVEAMRQVLSNEWFTTMVNHRFEEGVFPIPNGAEKWLTVRYGENYLKPPAKEMQGVKLDGFVKIDLNTPYTIYKGKYYCIDGKRHEKVKDNRWIYYS